MRKPHCQKHRVYAPKCQACVQLFGSRRFKMEKKMVRFRVDAAKHFHAALLNRLGIGYDPVVMADTAVLHAEALVERLLQASP